MPLYFNVWPICLFTIRCLLLREICKKKTTKYSRSRSELAPGSEFHPRDKSDKIDFGFLGPSWCNKKVNPDT